VLLYPLTYLANDSNPDIRKAYFGEGFEKNCRSLKASPVFVRLEGVAPTLMGVGSHDFLYRDNLAYAAALRAAKVPLVFREFPTLNHGFFSYTAISSICEAAAEKLCQDLRELLTNGPASA
jgi:acetyl esterase